MLYVDLPTRGDIERLSAVRAGACVSIYLPTTPLTQDAQADRIALKNLAGQALDALRSRGTEKAQVAALEEALADLVDDDEFWRFQARSLAVLATPGELLTFRLPSALEPLSMAADRFFIKPLLRAITVPQSAYVLALAQGAVRLVEVSAELPSVAVKVDGLPSDVASAVGKASITDRSASGRIHGAEGQKVRMRQYARQVDQALRDRLAGGETPLILAAAQPLDAIFRSVCSYPHLVAESIAGNPELLSDAELGQASRVLLDRLHRGDMEQLREQFEARSAQGRTTTDMLRRRGPRPSAPSARCWWTSTTSCPATSTTRAGSASATPALRGPGRGRPDRGARAELGARVLGPAPRGHSRWHRLRPSWLCF